MMDVAQSVSPATSAKQPEPVARPVSPQAAKLLEDAKTLLNTVIEDTAVPKNLKKQAGAIINQLNDSKNSLSLRLNSSISILDGMSGDHNLPPYVRTMLWQVASLLERAGTM